MLLFLSLISVILISGHLISLYHNKSYWPFDSYPMYSFPVRKLTYPIIVEKTLVMYRIVDTTAGQFRDLTNGYSEYHPDFHPLDRLEVMLLLIRSGMANSVFKEHKTIDQSHFSYGRTKSLSDNDNREFIEALKKLLNFARSNNTEIQKLAIEKLEWDNFEDPACDPLKPSRIQRIVEVTLD